MQPAPQPNPEAVAALPHRTQEDLLDAITQSIYNAAADRLVHRSAISARCARCRKSRHTVNLAQQYVQLGYDPEVFMQRLADIVCHDNFTEMHAFKHHQAVVEEYLQHPRAVALDAPGLRRPGGGDFVRQEHGGL